MRNFITILMIVLFNISLFVIYQKGKRIESYSAQTAYQQAVTDSIKKEYQRLDDSLFYIGYNFKESPITMDSLHFMGYIKRFRDAKQESGFHGW